MQIDNLHPVLEKKLRKFSLVEKFSKAKRLFEENSRHPSLHTELMEPKQFMVYSFRIDRKYRAQFTVVNERARILDINLHYQ